MLLRWRSRWPTPAGRSRPSRIHGRDQDRPRGTPPGDQPELIREVATSLTDEDKARQSPLGLQAEGALAGQQILDELEAASAAAAQKATPEEAAAFREWLLTSAQRAAEAAKEGGFMGFKAERISEGEQRCSTKLREALAA